MCQSAGILLFIGGPFWLTCVFVLALRMGLDNNHEVTKTNNSSRFRDFSVLHGLRLFPILDFNAYFMNENTFW